MKKVLCLILSLTLLLGTLNMGFAESTEIPVEASIVAVSEGNHVSGEEIVEESMEEPVVEPVEESTEEPVVEPVEESTEEPVVEPVEESTEEPVVEPVEESTEEPVVEPVEESSEEPVDESTDEPVEESTEAPVEEIESSDIASRSAVVITKQPESIPAAVGETVVFTVEATDAVAYRWYNSADGLTWKKTSLTGYNTNTLSVPVIEARYGYLWRCTLTDAAGETLDTEAVSILVPSEEPDPEPTPDGFAITTQPVNAAAAVGETATFTIEATGAASYRWYNSADGQEWQKSSLSGYNTTTLSVPVIEARYDYFWRCTVTDADGNTLESNAVQIVRPGTTEPDPDPDPEPSSMSITTQPVNVTAEIGETAVFTVEATGAASYRWYNSADGVTWKKTSIAGYSTNTLSVPVIEARYDYFWRCTLTDANGNTLDTDAVKIVKPVVEEPEVLAITTQPVDVTAEVGEIITFSVEATGVESYRWYNSLDGITWSKTSLTGYNTNTLTVTVSEVRYDYLWRCTLTDANGNTLDTNAVKMIKPVSFEITSQPVDVTAEVGEIITFSVEATGVDSYRWYNSRDGITWSKTSLTGYNTNTLTVTVSEVRYDYLWRCTLTDANGNTLDTNAVKMIKPSAVEPEEFAITTQPVNVTAEVGEIITFSVEATGVESYRWYNSRDGLTWNSSSLTGYNTDTLTVTVTEVRYDYLWRCTLTDADGNTLDTDAVKMVKPSAVEPEEFAITTQPVNVTAEVGEIITFSVEATGVKSYRWYNSPDGLTWSKTSLTGYNTDTLTVTVTEVRYDYLWRCTLTDADGNTLETDAVKMVKPGTVDPEPGDPDEPDPEPETFEILTQPVDVTAEIGENVTFTVEATGVAKYQWQNSPDGITWNNTRVTGYSTASISMLTNAVRYNYQWRCVLTDASGNTLITNSVRIVEPVLETFAIITQPVDFTAEVGETATFTIEATGAESYRWYNSPDGITWSKTSLIGYNTATLSVPVTEVRYNYQWRCTVTDPKGNTLDSNAVWIVKPAGEEPEEFKFTKQPEDVTADIGETITFSVEAVGVASYQWQNSLDGEAWSNSRLTGYNTDTLTIPVTAARYPYFWRCEITSAGGSVLFSNSVQILEPTDIVVDGVTYTKLEDGTLCVASYAGSAASVTIPETVNGLTVTVIGESAFEGNTTLTSIDLPDTITLIGKYAFKNCTSLSEMN